MKKLMLLLIGCALILACTKHVEPDSPAIVIIGDAALRLDDLRASIPLEMPGQLSRADLEEYVNRWIDAQILYQKGLELGLAENPEIQRRIKEFEVRLIGTVYLDSMLETGLKVPEEEVVAYYEENKDVFVREKEAIHLKQIQLPDKDTADNVYRALRLKRAEFDSLMIQYNGALPENERDLGYLTEDEIIQLLWDHIKRYRVGAVTRPIKTDFGYHIFQIVDKKPEGSVKDFAEVRREIEARLRQDKIEEKYNALMTQLKASVKVETYFDLLNRIPLDSVFVYSKPGVAQN